MKTRERLLVSAQKLFLLKGVDGTSTAQICKDVGVATGTLFVHFKTKQDLVQALYTEKKQGWMHMLDASVEKDASCPENVYTLSKLYVDYYLEHFDDFRCIQLLESHPDRPSIITGIMNTEKSAIQRVVAWGQDSGELKNMDQELLSLLWMNMLRAYMIGLFERKKTDISVDDLDPIWDALSADEA